MSHSDGSDFWDRVPPVSIPPRHEFDARDAVLGHDGGESHVVAQRLRFLMGSRESYALRIIETSTARLAKLRVKLLRADDALRWTKDAIPRASQGGRVRWSTRLIALLLMVVSGILAATSIFVLASWVLHSPSELFANDVLGAVLLASMPTAGSIALKCFELRLETPRARWVYGVALFGIGMASLVVWLVVVAVNFAPNSGGILAALAQAQSEIPTGIILLLSTGLCDLMFGASLLSAIGLLLSAPKDCEMIPNPAFAALTEEKSRLEQAVSTLEETEAAARCYVLQVRAGLELTQLEAEQTVQRARETYRLVHVVAQTLADAIFLSRNGGLR